MNEFQIFLKFGLTDLKQDFNDFLNINEKKS